MTPEEFRQYGHQLIDLIADYRQTAVRISIKRAVTQRQFRFVSG